MMILHSTRLGMLQAPLVYNILSRCSTHLERYLPEKMEDPDKNFAEGSDHAVIAKSGNPSSFYSLHLCLRYVGGNLTVITL